MKTWFLLLTGSVLLVLGYTLGNQFADSSAAEVELRQRLTALEARTALPATLDPVVAARDKVHTKDPNPRHLEVNLLSAQQALAERIARLERQEIVPSVDLFEGEFPDPEQTEAQLIGEERLQQAFTILEDAEDHATLDQTMQEELNQVLPEMDRRANKKFWQRFFAALDGGAIELPEVEHPDDGWLSGIEAAEVVRDSSDW